MSVTLDASVASPQPEGTRILLSASASGGTGPYSYRFAVQPSGGPWQIVQDWGASPTYFWKPSAGRYNVAVYARACDEGGEGLKAATFYVILSDDADGDGGGGGSTPMIGVALSADLSSPQPVETAVLLTAAGRGGIEPYSYRFWIQKWCGAWQLVQDWSPASTHL